MAIFKKRGEYWIDYYVGGRRRREKIGPSKKLAAAVLAKRKVQIAENRYLEIKKQSHLSFVDLCSWYLDYAKSNIRSWSTHTEKRLKHLQRYFGTRRASEITKDDLELYRKARLSCVSHATVNREIAVFKAMYNLAIAHERLSCNPADGIKLFREIPRIRYLSEKEIKLLLAFLPPSVKPLVIVALNTGMRRSELFNLRWSQIDWENNLIILSRTKNDQPRRVPMNKLVQETISGLPRSINNPYVFLYPDGSRIRDIRRPFTRALKRAGIDDFRFHDLRHTFASQLAMKGVQERTLAELLGHKSSAMVHRYSHLSPAHLAEAVGKLDIPISSWDRDRHHMDTKEMLAK